jgi:hypothetical protein
MLEKTHGVEVAVAEFSLIAAAAHLFVLSKAASASQE